MQAVAVCCHFRSFMSGLSSSYWPMDNNTGGCRRNKTSRLGFYPTRSWSKDQIDRLLQERRNSSALAMVLCLSCTNPRNKILSSLHTVLCLQLWGFVSRGPFYKHGLTLIAAWMSNYMLNKVWDEITNPFPNFTCSYEILCPGAPFTNMVNFNPSMDE